MKELYKSIIIHNIDTSNYSHMESFEPLVALKNIFLSEYGWNVSNPRGKSLSQICTDYLQGLPSACTVPFMNCEILVLLDKAGFSIPEDEDARCDAVDAYWVGVGEAMAELIGGDLV